MGKYLFNSFRGGHVNHSIFWTNLSPVSKNGGQTLGASSALTKGVLNHLFQLS
jgi:superoxide dismutase